MQVKAAEILQDKAFEPSKELTEHSLVQFLNHYIGSGHAIYTGRSKVVDNDSIKILNHPGRDRPIYVQVIRDERRILISKKAFGDYLKKERIPAQQVVRGLTKFFHSKLVKASLAVDTGYGKAQETVIELPVSSDSQLLEGMLYAFGRPE
jgi:hypothetical protein